MQPTPIRIPALVPLGVTSADVATTLPWSIHQLLVRPTAAV